MKKIIVTGVVSAIAAVGFAGTVSADGPSYVPGTPQCFGQVHKDVNAGAVVPGVENVGALLKALKTDGQGKKDLVKGVICVPTPPPAG